MATERLYRSPDQHATIRARTREPARLDVMLYNWNNRIVAAESSPVESRNHTISLTNLPRVVKGAYFYSVVASDEQGNLLGVHPGNPEGGELLNLRDTTMNSERNSISFFLPKSGFVRLRAGLKDGPCLETITPWMPSPGGDCSVAWDGTCQDGLLRNLFDHPSLQVTAVTISMPSNTLIDKGNWSDAEGAPPPSINLAPHLQRFRQPAWGAPSSRERGKLRRIEGDYRIELTATFDAPRDSALIRINCHPHDRPRLLNRPFELMLFLDTVFLMEDEQAILPFSYRLPTGDLAAGRHLVTVNIIDITGRLGTATCEIDTSPVQETGEEEAVEDGA